MTIVALYLGASDTLTNQLRWLTLVLAARPDLQDELLAEIEAAEESDGCATMNNCHLLQSVLLENFRCYPVADTLPHQATEDVVLGGFRIPKGSGIQGWLTAIMVLHTLFFQKPITSFRTTQTTLRNQMSSTQNVSFKMENLSKTFAFVHFPWVCAIVLANSWPGQSILSSRSKSSKSSS